MVTFRKVIGWSLVGSVIALILTYIGVGVFVRIIPQTEHNANLDGLLMASLGLSPWVGLVPGAIYGIFRARRVKKSPPT